MRFGEPIKLRLAFDKHLNYEREAERLGKTLAGYIRERLEFVDTIHAEIEALRNEVGGEVAAARRDIAGVRHGIERRNANGEAIGAPSAENALLIELLLLLRATTAPDRMSMVHAELERLGFDVWTYKAAKP